MDDLEEDHHRLIALFDQARCLADKGALAQAADVFKAFAQGARRHMWIEERWIFPCFEERTGSRTGLTATLRDEHHQLERLLDECAEALERGGADDFRERCRRLTLIVEDHAFHEEAQLYPVIEQILSPHERDACRSRMREDPLLPLAAPEGPDAARVPAGR
ncbi:MAG TPA: hemerythrin domain-containing protein [Polyangia bacterium]|nr:hemerythrin domain-containing protein [Polyangia bacterium]